MRTQEEAQRLTKNAHGMFTRFGISITDHNPPCQVYIIDAEVFDNDKLDHCVEYLEDRNIYPMWYNLENGYLRFVIQIAYD